MPRQDIFSLACFPLPGATDGGACGASGITRLVRLAARVSNRALRVHPPCSHATLFHARWCALAHDSLLANQELSSESREARGAGVGRGRGVEPADEAEDSGRQGREEVLEVRLALRNIACAAHPRVARGWCEGPFNPTARRVSGAKLGCLLPGPRGLRGLAIA